MAQQIHKEIDITHGVTNCSIRDAIDYLTEIEEQYGSDWYLESEVDYLYDGCPAMKISFDFYRDETEEERKERENKVLVRKYRNAKEALRQLRASGMEPTEEQKQVVADAHYAAKDAGAL